MRIIFFGNTKYSKIVAESLQNNFGVSAVVTLPDQPQGRKKLLTPTPVKAFAKENNVAVIEALKLDTEAIEKIQQLQPDFLVVSDYRLFLSPQLLALPASAPINVHHSLLPKYRGPSPAPSAILAGEKISGVTIMIMAEQLDAGDILAQKEYTLQPDETTDSLLTQLNTLGAEMLLSVLKNYQKYAKNAKQQDNAQATFTQRMNKEDGHIDLEKPPTAEQFDRMVRAYYPWPNVWTKVQMANNEWQIVKFYPKKTIQLEGKNPVDRETFYRGYPELKEKIEKLYK